MMEFLKAHQLNLMLILMGVNLGMAVLASFTKVIPKKRKHILVSIELGAALLLFFDRLAYLYRGDVSTAGYYVVRIANFATFFLTIILITLFEAYLRDLYTKEGGLKQAPRRLNACWGMSMMACWLLIVSQFTGWYYTFDAQNFYHRGPLFVLCYVFPVGMMVILLSVIIQYRNRLSRYVYMGILLFTLVPFIASIIQIFCYGLSLINISMVGMAVLLYFLVLDDMNLKARKATEMEISYAKAGQRISQTLFEQTAETLATAIDAKDRYAKGHSLRVAEYARKIAEAAGKDSARCYEIYYAALLHDVGKLGIRDNIIGKMGKLTDEEYEEMKTHSQIGSDILSSITKFPYLSIAAKYHHERYDGKGYPEHLKGEDTPEIARIIAVADAYDAMSSNRSYRSMLPQQKVREEILKGSGTQFDPKFAKIMIHLIDEDVNYEMKQRESLKELSGRDSLYCNEYGGEYSEGIHLSDCITRIHIHSRSDNEHTSKNTVPSLILFDSLDERVHYKDGKEQEMNYMEFGVISLNGTVQCKEARKIQKDVNYLNDNVDMVGVYREGLDYDIDAVRVKDHISIKVRNKYQNVDYTIALPDSIRFAYIALTGEYCNITQVGIHTDDKKVSDRYISRIAEEVSYIDGPVGDIPNVQINNWCSETSQAVPLKDKMTIRFHAKTMPPARLIWHCPYIRLFYSEDQKVDGPGYKNFIVVRLDGENWDSDPTADNEVNVEVGDDFVGWDVWKERHRQGFECEVRITREDDKIHIETENFGLKVSATTVIKQKTPEVYVCLTGDIVALTNIRITE